MSKYAILIFALFFFAMGCYHARVTTGLEASNEVYEQKWAAGFIAGLVPPDLVQAGQQCSNGVAIVETRLSFMNQFVTFLSMGIYSPMEIKVTCAAASAHVQSEGNTLQVAAKSSDDEFEKTMRNAIKLSGELNEPVYLQFK